MKISIQGLKQGITEFIDVVPSGFINKEYAHFYADDFTVKVIVDKIEKDLRVKLLVKSTAHFTCDRCLKDFTTNLEIEFEQMYKLGYVDNEIDKEMISISADAKEIDLAPILNEAVLLQHPIKMLCKEDCKGLCVGCGVDLNLEKCKCTEAGNDPRWDKLRQLIK